MAVKRSENICSVCGIPLKRAGEVMVHDVNQDDGNRPQEDDLEGIASSGSSKPKYRKGDKVEGDKVLLNSVSKGTYSITQFKVLNYKMIDRGYIYRLQPTRISLYDYKQGKTVMEIAKKGDRWDAKTDEEKDAVRSFAKLIGTTHYLSEQDLTPLESKKRKGGRQQYFR